MPQIKIKTTAFLVSVIVLLLSLGFNIAALLSGVTRFPQEEQTPQQPPISQAVIEINQETTFYSQALQMINPEMSNIIQIIWRLAPDFNLNPRLVLAIVMTESDGRTGAIHRKSGCLGLMQINYVVWQRALKLDRNKLLMNPEYNLRTGMEILRRYLVDTGGNVEKALHRYNMGYSGENIKYVNKVLTYLSL